MITCDVCGQQYGVGDWPFCNHGRPSGMLGQFPERWDEHIAPPPSEDFKPIGAPEYHPDRGWKLTSLGDKHRLMKLARTKER